MQIFQFDFYFELARRERKIIKCFEKKILFSLHKGKIAFVKSCSALFVCEIVQKLCNPRMIKPSNDWYPQIKKGTEIVLGMKLK